MTAQLDVETRPAEAPAGLRPPLEGLRIVDLTQFQSGPMVTLIAGDLGAEVIKVESIQRVDGWRGGGRGERRWEKSPNFNWVNRNKKGITLNLTDPRGADILRRLVARSDVVVENYTPRVMANFGLDYDRLREIRPDLIMVSMPGFGGDSPWRDYTAFAWTTEQMSTLCHLTGYADSGPLFTSTTGGDPLAALMGTLALFAALNHRRRTGEGQHIDLSQLETATAFAAHTLVEAQLAEAEPTRRGNDSPLHSPHGAFPCRGEDSWLALACRSDAEWAGLCEELGIAADSDGSTPLATTADRLAARDAVREHVARGTAQRDADDLMQRLQARGIAAGVVVDGARMLADPHLAARGFWVVQDREGVGPKHYPGQPFRMSASPFVEPRRAPYLGEWNEAVLGGLLGVAAEQLRELAGDKVIGTDPLGA
ncbi:CaiB/BaiF CoA transferase family protein [Geodermatophilus sp. URMC 64]